MPGWSRIMINDKIFGETSAKDLSVGDIVEWSRWNSKETSWDMNYGIITSISNEIRSNRLVSICRVMPLNDTTHELEFFTLSLRLISPTDREKYTNDIKN